MNDTENLPNVAPSDELPEKIFGVDRDIFLNHFYDVRRHSPKPGQIMAKFRAAAEFIDGREKRDVIMLLKMDKAQQAAMVMKKIHLAREPDCYRICREMCQDLLTGMSEEEVEKKVYEFILEAFFYVERQYVPGNDPRWETISLLEWDEEDNTFKSRLEIPSK